jgi:hypothetical protein
MMLLRKVCKIPLKNLCLTYLAEGEVNSEKAEVEVPAEGK